MKLRPGYTLTEVLVAALLIATIAVGIGRVLGQATRHTRASHYRTVAAHLAQNEIERIRIAGPLDQTGATDTVRLDGRGSPTPSGTYLLEIDRQVRCEGGPEPADNTSRPLPIEGGCSTAREVSAYSVRVHFPVEGEQDAGYVEYSLALGPRSLHGAPGVSR